MTDRRKALLLLDYQVALCEEGPHLRMPPLAAQVAERDVLATATRVLEAARAAGWLVVPGPARDAGRLAGGAERQGAGASRR
jgi:nicotinamidase-related amidase